MISNFPEVLNFNRSFVEINLFICDSQADLPIRRFRVRV